MASCKNDFLCTLASLNSCQESLLGIDHQGYLRIYPQEKPPSGRRPPTFHGAPNKPRVALLCGLDAAKPETRAN